MNGRRGRPPHPDVLTPAEWAVVDAVRHGMPGPLIAQRRGVSRDAIKFHVANVLRKLGLADRTELRAWRGAPAGSALAQRRQGVTLDSSRKENRMLDSEMRLGALGQVARHVTDVERAVAWYRDTLGLTYLYQFGDLAFFDCAGVRLFLSKSENKTSESSILYFRVPDIDAAYDELTTRGVTFEGAPHLIFRHDSGLEEWMAFFPDPDGHLLAIMSQVEK
ncbi:MAG TPA: VOC family protein [Trebonia sp.]